MTIATLMIVPAATSWLSSQTIGEAVLISVGAIVLGYVVALYWPKQHSPSLFGSLAAITVVGFLAYLGNSGAVVAIFFVVIGCAALAAAGIM